MNERFIVLRVAAVKSDDFVSDDVLAGSQGRWDREGILVSVSDELDGGPGIGRGIEASLSNLEPHSAKGGSMRIFSSSFASEVRSTYDVPGDQLVTDCPLGTLAM